MRFLSRFGFWAALAAGAGAAVRVSTWLRAGSLNSDELFIAVNLQRRGFLGLAGALDYDQLAPTGWLWLEKAIYLLDRGDTLLRLPALLAGCVAVALTAVLARRLLSPMGAVAATLLVAGNPLLIYQSAQVKPYTIEAATAVGLLILAVRVPAGGHAPRDVRRFWLAGAVAIWFATTATFVVASVGGLLLLHAARASRGPGRAPTPGSRPAALHTAALRTTVLRTAALRTTVLRTTVLRTTVLRTTVLRTTVLRTAALHPGSPGGWSLPVRRHLLAAVPAVASVCAVRLLAAPVAPWVYHFWAANYPYSLGPGPFRPAEWISWSGRLFEGVTDSALSVAPGRPAWITGALAVIGAVGLALRRPRRAALVCVPLCCGYLLALLRLYPMGARVATWLVPSMLLLVAAGADTVLRIPGYARTARRPSPDAAVSTAGPGPASATPPGPQPATPPAPQPTTPPGPQPATPPAPQSRTPPGPAPAGSGRGLAPIARLVLAPGGGDPSRLVRAVAVLAVATLAAGLVYAFQPSWGRAPRYSNASRYALADGAIRWIARQQRPGDRVYVYRSGVPLAAWYAPQAGMRWDGRFTFRTGVRCSPDPAAAHLTAGSRVWLVLRAWGSGRKAMVDAADESLGRYGTRIAERWFGIFLVQLYRITPLPAAPPARSPGYPARRPADRTQEPENTARRPADRTQEPEHAARRPGHTGRRAERTPQTTARAARTPERGNGTCLLITPRRTSR